MRKLSSGHDRGISDVHAMMHFVFFLQAAQDGDGRFDAGFIDHDFLKATLERCVFFNVLAILIQRGRAHAVKLASRECGLQHIAGIHRAFGFTRADHGVHFVDEDDGLTFVLCKFFEDGFEALLEFTAILGTRQQGRHIKR